MNTWIKKGIAVAAALATATTGIVLGLGTTGSAAPTATDSAATTATSLRAFGITSDGRLMATFTTDRPDVLNWVRVVSGLVGDTYLIGIDFRVQDGLMYGVGNLGGVYQIFTVDGVATKKVSQLTVPLYGTNFGVDFNPAADRLRIVSDNGQNLSHNLAGSTTEQSTLTSPPTEGTTRGVTAVAYTNNDLSPRTNTTLFAVDTTKDQVAVQSPPNLGLLVATGNLEVDAGSNAGFDIYSDLTNGRTTSLTAFGTFITPDGAAKLYDVHLLTGLATPIGQFPLPLTDIAVALDTTY